MSEDERLDREALALVRAALDATRIEGLSQAERLAKAFTRLSGRMPGLWIEKAHEPKPAGAE
jgi:hypothetical protein